MIRVRNWDIALFRWLTKKVGKPFRWGRTDCACLGIGACRAMYGKNLFADVGAWNSLRTAKDTLDGVGDPRDLFERQGAILVKRAFVQSGDIAYSGSDDLGFPQIAVIWNSKALVSTPGECVRIVQLSELADDAEFWRLPNA